MLIVPDKIPIISPLTPIMTLNGRLVADSNHIIKGIAPTIKIFLQNLKCVNTYLMSLLVEAFENGDMNSIYLRAKKQVMLDELYREWVDLYRCQQYEEDYGEYLDSYSCKKLR